MSASRFPFIARVMLSIDGAIAFGSTRWLGSSRIGFVARTYAVAGTTVKLRLFLPDTQQPVDAAVMLERVRPIDGWSQVSCTGVITRMNVQHQELLDECLRRAPRPRIRAEE